MLVGYFGLTLLHTQKEANYVGVKLGDGSLLSFLDGEAVRALSHMDGSMCSSAPNLEMIDEAIQVRSNVDPTFYSLVGSGRSGRDHLGSSLLENPYIPYQYMDSYLSSIGLGRPQWENKIEHLTTYLHRPRTTRSPISFWGDGGIGPEDLKKDLRVSKVGPGGFLNAFFFLLIGVISQTLAMVRKKGGTSTLGVCSTMKSCAMIYFMGEVSSSSPGWPSYAKEKNKRIKQASDSFMQAGGI
ncbi:putative chloroplast RF68 [Cucumis melo var. makuwa]|uniref:Uncharacterized protein ycf68 n=1 Tax=Cucumis melo var. makuwa TaxID=1194695 RepID=A0A5A7UBD6_CUCMM|nr:putative chloroplast RF68 [Cucumis melo var. makuwa]